MFGVVYVVRDGKVIPRDSAPPLHPRFGEAPFVISDCMNATRNHADGRIYDSKRAFAKAVRAKGCEIIGNESPYVPPPPGMDDPTNDVVRAIETVEQRQPTRKKKKRKT